MKLLLALTGLVAGSVATAQTTPRGLEKSALPAINFNSDEGFGYGITAQVYQYGDGTLKPYKYTIQPLIFLTTKGRRDISVFFDAPHLLPADWRLGVYAGLEQQLAAPYYGLGNSSDYDKSREELQNKYYYRFGRRGFRLNADFQHVLAGPLRMLAGTSVRTWSINQTPFDTGVTKLNSEVGPQALPKGRTVAVRAGLVYDTRDRETGPTKGWWLEALGQKTGEALGGTNSFARMTGTARRYLSLNDRLVWAQRGVAQHIEGNAPFYELSAIQGSFRESEGLGGAGSVRGLPQNRYVGKGLVFFNEELRYRAADFRLSNRESALILSTFWDGGRVWERGLYNNETSSGFHYGFGGGARLLYGENFVVALDVAHSRDGTPIYIGLGYPF